MTLSVPFIGGQDRVSQGSQDVLALAHHWKWQVAFLKVVRVDNPGHYRLAKGSTNTVPSSPFA